MYNAPPTASTRFPNSAIRRNDGMERESRPYIPPFPPTHPVIPANPAIIPAAPNRHPAPHRHSRESGNPPPDCGRRRRQPGFRIPPSAGMTGWESRPYIPPFPPTPSRNHRQPRRHSRRAQPSSRPPPSFPRKRGSTAGLRTTTASTGVLDSGLRRNDGGGCKAAPAIPAAPNRHPAPHRHSRESGNPPPDCARRQRQPGFWIPAYAGVTGWESRPYISPFPPIASRNHR